jgi:hypothetical protein
MFVHNDGMAAPAGGRGALPKAISQGMKRSMKDK